MESGTTNDQLGELTRLVNAHQADLMSHQAMFREFRSQFFHGEDSESPCLVELDQDQLDNLKNLTNEFKTTVDSLCHCLYSIQATKIAVSTSVTEPPRAENHHWPYQENLSKAVQRWKTEAKKRRETGHCKSLVEWFRDKELGKEQEESKERKAFRFIHQLGIDSGLEISSLIVEYFFFLVRSRNPQDIDRRIRLFKTTLRSLSLVGDDDNNNNNNNNRRKSTVVEAFIRVVKTIERGIINNNNNINNNDIPSDESVDDSNENFVLRTVFESVFRLEFGFSYPFSGKKESSPEQLNMMKASVAMRASESSLEIRSLASERWNCQEDNPELRTLHRTLHREIAELWKGLDLI